MEVEVKDHLERAELQAILSAGVFAKSPNLAKLLNYICEKYWEGKSGQIKEYNLAVEALGRPPDFDPATSAIVRVEVHRLREKLKKYYETEGLGHRIVISIQPGHYVPQFSLNDGDAPPRTIQDVGHASARSVESASGRLIPVLTEDAQPVIRLRNPLRSASGSRWRTLLIVAGLGLVAISIFAFLHYASARSANSNPAGADSSRLLPVAAAGGQSGVRIIAGYSRKNYIDQSGNVWSGDAYFQGGDITENPDKLITRTSDPTLFQAYRHGEFSYNIPLKPGDYDLWLYFVETMYGPRTLRGGGETSRLFDVDVKGRTILSEFDVFSDAGGNFIADVRVFKNITPARDGFLHIQFIRHTEEPFVNAIKVVPSLPGRLQPIRIVAGENSYTDGSGAKWDPDRYYSGGRPMMRRNPVVNTPEPGLFNGERYGNFDYAIPVAQGKYTVTLYFSERYFGPGAPGGGGVGSRVFNVSCNGAVLLKNIDIFKEAGGTDRALVKTFHGLEANAQGKLVLRFLPVVNYALVNAIQVTDESR